MEMKRSGSQPSSKGPADWFTGTVRIDPLFPATAPARAAGNSVTFEPGARTAWHTHPLGQTLIVTAGCGRVQRRGNPAGRCGLVRVGREALARRCTRHGHDAYRHSGAARRQGRRLDGKGQRRTIPAVTASEGRIMSNNIAGKVIVITGASSGLGEAAAWKAPRLEL